MLSYIVYGAVALAALLFYAWLDGLWFWTRPEKGQLDVDVEANKPAEQHVTNDLKYIEGKSE